jgi:hypothetical protein
MAGREIARKPSSVAVITVGRSPTDPAVKPGFPKDKERFFLLDGVTQIMSSRWEGPRRQPLEGSEAWNGPIKVCMSERTPYRYIVDATAQGRSTFRARMIRYEGGMDSSFVCASQPGSKSRPPYGRPWCSSDKPGQAERFDAQSKEWQSIECFGVECEHKKAKVCKVRTLIQLELLEPGFEGLPVIIETGSENSLSRVLRTIEDVEAEWAMHRDQFGIVGPFPWTGVEVRLAVAINNGIDEHGRPRSYPLISMTLAKSPLELLGDRVRLVSGQLQMPQLAPAPELKLLAEQTLPTGMATVIEPTTGPTRRDGKPTASSAWGAKMRDAKAQLAIDKALSAIRSAETLSALQDLEARFYRFWPETWPGDVREAYDRREEELMPQEPEGFDVPEEA